MCYNHDESLTPEQAESLEAEFIKLAAETKAEIEKKLAAAQKLIDEAIAISKETGIPFSANFIGAHNGYVPGSFVEGKFSKLDPELITELCDVYDAYGDKFEYSGWVHSNFCTGY